MCEVLRFGGASYRLWAGGGSGQRCGDSGAQTTHREATRGGKGHNGIEHIQDMADGRWQMGRRGVERTQDPTVARETNAATQKAQEQEKTRRHSHERKRGQEVGYVK